MLLHLQADALRQCRLSDAQELWIDRGIHVVQLQVAFVCGQFVLGFNDCGIRTQALHLGLLGRQGVAIGDIQFQVLGQAVQEALVALQLRIVIAFDLDIKTLVLRELRLKGLTES